MQAYKTTRNLHFKAQEKKPRSWSLLITFRYKNKVMIHERNNRFGRFY